MALLKRTHKMEEAHFNAQPFFVLNDEAYLNIANELRNGKPFVKSYATTCPHRERRRCRCPYFKNVLVDGNIWREFNGQLKPVFSVSALREVVAKTQ